MDPAGTGAVVVGVDGSMGSARALDVAIGEATLRSRTLRMVHAFPWPVYTSFAAVAAYESIRPDARDSARQMLAEQAAYARNEAPDLRVEEVFSDGVAAAELIGESAGAALTVLGRRGLGGFSGLLLGSVSTQVAAHGSGPVMVVPASGIARTGPVVVGVDTSGVSQHAVGYAFDEAAWHDAPLTVVHAHSREEPSAVEERVLAEAVAGWQEKYPEVAVTRALEQATPTAALLSHAAHARVLVVGSRGRGGFRGLLLGSTSQALLHHGSCPVVVVHERVAT